MAEQSKTQLLDTPSDAERAEGVSSPAAEGATSLQQLAVEALKRPADQQIIEYGKQWYHWGEVRHIAERLRALVAASGVDARAPVAFIPHNRPSAAATLLALLSMGRTIRMIYAFQSPTGIARDIGRLKPSLAIAAAEVFSDEVRAVLEAEGIAAVTIEEMDAKALPGFETGRRETDPDAPHVPRIEILTSGTTGPPKQFPISYDMVAKHMVAGNLMKSSAADVLKLPPGLLFFPLGNISGIYTTVPALISGMRFTLLERFSIPAWHDYVVRHRPTHTGLPPSAVQTMLDANIPPEDLSSIKALGAGAAPLDPTVQRAFEERYGIPVLLSYGATEFGGPVTAMTAELHAEWGQTKFGTVGRAFNGAKLRVIDPETGDVLPPGQEGLLEVVSPRIGPDWIRTSDMAVLDEDGFLFHRGRADGAITRGGFKLLPETIERALLEHEAVSTVGVVGVPDRRLGQVPGAVIQLKPGQAEPSIAELEAHLRKRVLATHIPVHWRFVEAMPLTPSVKIDRPGLKALFADVAS